MEIINQYPPNIKEIRAKFNLDGKKPVFAFGDKIYNPFGVKLPDHIIEHEKTHFDQQAEIGLQDWWDRYLVDAEFRLNQELEAYRHEYQFMQETMNRSDRRSRLQMMAKDLASAMYGNIITKKRAEELITFNQ